VEPMADTTAEAVAVRFLKCFYSYHGLPRAITSDRGPQFVSSLWRRICELLEIEQRLSTGYHPQTDGATERANQEVEKVLRIFTTFLQNDWDRLLPIASMAINGREAASTGLSPFFFTHGYHVEPIALEDDQLTAEAGTPKAAGEAFVQRMAEAQDWAQAAIAVAQERQQSSANQHRKAAPVYQEGDQVWLDLRNIKTVRPSKKLDWLHAKYRVRRVVSSHAVELEVPTGVHPVFHVDLLRPAAKDPLPSQVVDDSQPPPILEDGQQEYDVDEVLCAEWRGTQKSRKRFLLIKWQGYAIPTWEPLTNFVDTEALDLFETRYGSILDNDGPLHLYKAPPRGKKRTREGGG
jgi:hypothetical protein